MINVILTMEGFVMSPKTEVTLPSFDFGLV